MAPKRSTKTGEKALLTALEGYSLEVPQLQKAEQEPKAKSKAKAKVKAKSKGNGTKKAEKKEDAPEDSQDLQSQAPPGSGAGAGEQLKEQFHAALSKLDDLACVKRQRVMPAEL
mmetsp:Transcript_43050/g.93582  ORF Transcript_43050/g.93582 Transcript_43050/m.93582 type:complete len:114 (-) Transcript_43050:5-346(-)